VGLKKHHIGLHLILALFVIISFALAACQQATPSPVATSEVEDQTEVTVATQPADAGIDPATGPSIADENPLPADPIAMTFTARDGVELAGMFYPAATTTAPVIVLMHWAPGDQSDWRAIAAWLQNRDLQVELGGVDQPWLDPSWFPVFADEYSFNVFTFTFRGCEGGCTTFDREGWRLDVEAAMGEVVRMDNVDHSSVLTIGASIGADGAAYGCHTYNTQLGGCQGAFSLSPGGYLGIPYDQEVANLKGDLVGRPAWCLYAEGDSVSAAACLDASGLLYKAVDYPGSLHGMRLINPEQDPNPLELILDFIHDYLQCDICSL